MIFIPNMEIPETCDACPFGNQADAVSYGCACLDYCFHMFDYASFRHEDCPLKDFDDLTIFGYNARNLIAFAIACEKYGVDKRDLKAFANNCEWALKAISDEQRKAFEEAWKKSFGGVLCVEDLP